MLRSNGQALPCRQEPLPRAERCSPQSAQGGARLGRVPQLAPRLPRLAGLSVLLPSVGISGLPLSGCKRWNHREFLEVGPHLKTVADNWSRGSQMRAQARSGLCVPCCSVTESGSSGACRMLFHPLQALPAWELLGQGLCLAEFMLGMVLYTLNNC